MGSLPRSIPPSLRDTKRKPLGIRVRPVDDNQSHFFIRLVGSSAVMAVTLLRDGGYSSPVQLSAYFQLRGRCKMQKDERDHLEVLIFDEIEETAGTWLRAIIRRLEKERTVIQMNHQSTKLQAAKRRQETSFVRIIN